VFCLLRYPGLSWTEFGPPEGAPGANVVFWVRRLPLLALPEFLSGISLGWLFLKFRPGARAAAVMAWGGAIATVAALVFSDHLPFLLLHNGLLIPLFATAIVGLSYDNSLARLLSADWLVLLGEASFSLYLVHFLFNDWWARHVDPQLTLGRAAVKLAIVIPMSVLLHLFVERPCRRLILGWWSRRHPAQLVLEPAKSSPGPA
jgi:peptidoglycan/LPS O-acetylase OafA/YrhL